MPDGAIVSPPSVSGAVCEPTSTPSVAIRWSPRIVVRWTNPLSSQREPNRRGRPSGSRLLDHYLTREYQPVATFGDYRVLERN